MKINIPSEKIKGTVESIVAVLGEGEGQVEGINPEEQIKQVIKKFFMEYIHKDIGKLLTVEEKENVNLITRPNLKKGSLVVYGIRYDEYVWAVILGKDGEREGDRYKIAIKDGDNYREVPVYSCSLFHYPDVMERKFRNYNILDSYDFNKLE